MYDKAMNGVHKRLIHKSSPSGLTYISEWKNGSPLHKMDHLACFVGGLLVSLYQPIIIKSYII